MRKERRRGHPSPCPCLPKIVNSGKEGQRPFLAHVRLTSHPCTCLLTRYGGRVLLGLWVCVSGRCWTAVLHYSEPCLHVLVANKYGRQQGPCPQGGGTGVGTGKQWQPELGAAVCLALSYSVILTTKPLARYHLIFTDKETETPRVQAAARGSQ